MADELIMHPDWPLRFVTRPDGTVTYAEVEQDTNEERKASAAVVVATRRGANLGDATFGVTSTLFDPAPLDVARLAREIEQTDPRLDVTVTETADLVNAMRRKLSVAVGAAPASTEPV